MNSNKTTYDQFVHEEYIMLKDAHFQTSSRITSFFQFAILFFSAPMILLAAASKIEDKQLGLTFMVIGFIGLFIMIYLSRLRAEALMYARNMNKIRNFVYSQTNKSIPDIQNEKILLSQENKPSMADWGQFGFIVYTLGCLDSMYLSYGVYLFFLKHNVETCRFLIAGFVGLVWFGFHCLAHHWSSNASELGSDYYKRRIGVDIDGVLNDHETEFAKIYKRLNPDSKLEPEDITTLPVSKNKNLNIPQEKEHEVFKTLNYWTEMPALERAKDVLIGEIKNKLGYSIYYYTWRAWKIEKQIEENGEVKEPPSSNCSIETVTKEWLKKQGLFDKGNRKIVFEEGNIDQPVRSFKVKYRNRYYYARQKKLRYFVEDSLPNALHLAKTCEYVFLINHPYNQENADENIPSPLPYNIIRVESWDEIYEHIKSLG